jgi:hypothetical protein
MPELPKLFIITSARPIEWDADHVGVLVDDVWRSAAAASFSVGGAVRRRARREEPPALGVAGPRLRCLTC